MTVAHVLELLLPALSSRKRPTDSKANSHLSTMFRNRLEEKVNVRQQRVHEEGEQHSQLLAKCEAMHAELKAEEAEEGRLRQQIADSRASIRTADERYCQQQERLCKLRERLPGLRKFIEQGQLKDLQKKSDACNSDFQDSEVAPRVAALEELRRMLCYTSESVFACRLAWTVLLALGLALGTGVTHAFSKASRSMWHWLVLVTVAICAIAIEFAKAIRARHFNSEVLLEDEYDVEQLMFAQHPVHLHNDAYGVEFHVNFMFALPECLLHVRLLSFYSFGLLVLHQIFMLAVFFVARPQLCIWRPLLVNDSISGELKTIAGGDVLCDRDIQNILWLSSPEAVVWLMQLMPVWWGMAWYCLIRMHVAEGAEVLCAFVDRREELLLSGLMGSDAFTLSWERLWEYTLEFQYQEQRAWWLAWTLLLDGSDCVNLWSRGSSDARIVVCRVVNAPNSGDPVYLLRQSIIPFVRVRIFWCLNLAAVVVALLGLFVSTFRSLLIGRLKKARITRENKHKMFLRFMNAEMGMPKANSEALAWAIRASLMLEVPLCSLRFIASAVFQVPISVFATKNVVCLISYVRTILNLTNWHQRARALRAQHWRAVHAFDQGLSNLSKTTLDQDCAYQRIGELYDKIDGPEKQTFALYCTEIDPLPVAAAAR